MIFEVNLIAFQHPLMSAIRSLAMIKFALISCTVDRTGGEVINGLEGRRLLSALTAFVKAAVNFIPKVHSKQGELLYSHRYILIDRTGASR